MIFNQFILCQDCLSTFHLLQYMFTNNFSYSTHLLLSKLFDFNVQTQKLIFSSFCLFNCPLLNLMIHIVNLSSKYTFHHSLFSSNCYENQSHARTRPQNPNHSSANRYNDIAGHEVESCCPNCRHKACDKPFKSERC